MHFLVVAEKETSRSFTLSVVSIMTVGAALFNKRKNPKMQMRNTEKITRKRKKERKAGVASFRWLVPAAKFFKE